MGAIDDPLDGSYTYREHHQLMKQLLSKAKQTIVLQHNYRMIILVAKHPHVAFGSQDRYFGTLSFTRVQDAVRHALFQYRLLSISLALCKTDVHKNPPTISAMRYSLLVLLLCDTRIEG